MMKPSSIPVLELDQFANDKNAFVTVLGNSYQEYGFCGIAHHGIRDTLIENAFSVSRELFLLPQKIKQKYSMPEKGGARGYTGYKIEVAKDSHYPDLKEFWHIGREVGEVPPHESLLPNIWPEEIPRFRERVYPLFEAMDKLGNTILRALALYLNLDENYFSDKVNYGNSILRLLHYPPVTQNEAGSIRAGAHEDINLITLLAGSHESGLEILRRDGQWIPVSIIPGTIIVNIGDMLQRLTNHVFRSTTHRVVNPDSQNVQVSRYSIPFFLHPNHDFIIKTLPQCITPENPDRYPEPISANDYLAERLGEIGLLGKKS